MLRAKHTTTRRYSCRCRCRSLKPNPTSFSSFDYSPWSGLQNWRHSLNHNCFWGPNGPQPNPKQDTDDIINDQKLTLIDSASSPAQFGALVLSTSDPLTKSKISHLGFTRWYNEKAQTEDCHVQISNNLQMCRMVMEARGLDAGPRLVQKLIGFGDLRTSYIVARIADEEVAHVAVGVDWFVSVCKKMDRTPCSTFKELLKDYGVEVKGPFNYSARDEAGIPRDWYATTSLANEQLDEKQKKDEQLSVVHKRLASIIAMESDN